MNRGRSKSGNQDEIYIAMVNFNFMEFTFIDAVTAWRDAMKTKQMSAIDALLSPEFTWESVNNETSTSRKDTMEWIATTNFSIGEFTTIYDGEDILCGTYPVFETGKDETIVMCVIELTANRNKEKTWTISSGNFYRNTRTISSFVPFV